VVASRGPIGPPGIEGWIGGRPAALETLRALISKPAGSRVVDLERATGDPNQVVRTLNELQNAGLVRIHIEHATHELVARVSDKRLEELRMLLDKVGK
jgi:2-methylisocitrate lyase-like PEP mutase family enzyme